METAGCIFVKILRKFQEFLTTFWKGFLEIFLRVFCGKFLVGSKGIPGDISARIPRKVQKEIPERSPGGISVEIS